MNQVQMEVARALVFLLFGAAMGYAYRVASKCSKCKEEEDVV